MENKDITKIERTPEEILAVANFYNLTTPTTPTINLIWEDATIPKEGLMEKMIMFGTSPDLYEDKHYYKELYSKTIKHIDKLIKAHSWKSTEYPVERMIKEKILKNEYNTRI